MTKYLILLGLLLAVGILQAQDLLTSRHTSPFTYIYQLHEKEARRIHQRQLAEVNSSYFHSLVTSFPTDSAFDESSLPDGHYLKVHAENAQLQVAYTSVQHFDVAVMNNSADLNIRVFTTAGEIIRGARVTIGGKKLHFDPKTETYRDRHSNRKGLLCVAYEGFEAYYELSRQHNNPVAKRVLIKTVSGTPLRYAWRPVSFVVRLPKSAVRSIRYGSPQGGIYWIVDKSVRLFHHTLCLFDDYHCDWYGDSWKVRNRHTGYLAFSKPRYMPGDTIKFKAYLIKRKSGKPLNEAVYPVWLYNGKHLETGALEPYAAGGYSGWLVLHDTLGWQLDRQVTLELQDEDGETYIQDSFKYEDYELGKTTLKLDASAHEQFAGDSIRIRVTGTDENELNIMDGRLEVRVTTKQVHQVFDASTFVPNLLDTRELPLDPAKPTEILLTEEFLPKANLEYSVEVTMITADQERKVETVNISYWHEQAQYEYVLRGDSIDFRWMRNGQSQPKEVLIAGNDAFGNEVESYAVTLPATLPLNPYFFDYDVWQGDTLRLSVAMSQQSSEVSFNAYRTVDSLFVSCQNPRKIPFVYYLYKTGHEVARGNGTSLSIRERTTTHQNYYLAVQYLWGGEVTSHNYEIALDESELQINLTVPPVVYPGQTVELVAHVTDYKGEPAADTDLLLHGLTAKFKAGMVTLPDLDEKAKQRPMINTFTLKNREMEAHQMQLDYERWNPLMVLDSVAWYQFLYPDSLYQYSYVPKDSVTQFSPFVVQDGNLQPVNVIYFDNQVVYMSWTSDQPYSFGITPGIHDLRIRTDLHEYFLYDLCFEKGEKLILSLNHDHLPRTVNSYKRSLKYTPGERSNLARYTMPYRPNYGSSYGYIQQGDRFFKIQPNRVNPVVGPVSEQVVRFHIYNQLDQSVWYEPFFEYDVQSGLVKMRSRTEIQLVPEYTGKIVRRELTDRVNTKDLLWEQWQQELKRRRLSERRYVNPQSTADGEGLLRLSLPTGTLKQQVLNTLLFKLDDAKFLQIYPGLQRQFHGLKGGYYRLIFLHEEQAYSMLDSLQIQENGENHVKTDVLLFTQKDTFSIRMNDLMDAYFERNKNGNGIIAEKEKLFQTYQQQFQYFGSGEVISGIVTDESGEPLPGANVLVKGTTYGTVTDLDGYYSINVPSGNKTLTISFIGYETKEIHTEESSGNIALTVDVQQLSEVVIIGYGTLKKASLTASVATVHSLQGRVAGVAVSADSMIRVRGVGSVTGDAQPMIVVDGVPYFGDISTIEKDQISEMEVLKSDDMVALYGSRAAGGVIIIQTKNGASIDRLSKTNGATFSKYQLQEMISQGGLRKRFSDEAFWQPALRTDKNGEVRVKVTLPGDMTSWSVRAYAMNDQRQNGSAVASIKSFKPLAAQLAIPRFILPGDTAWAIGKSLNYTYDTARVKTTFERNGEVIRSNEAAFRDAHIDSLLITTQSLDSVQLKYYLERADGYFDGEERYLAVYPVGLEKSVGQYAALRGDTAVSWSFSDSLGQVNLYACSRDLELLRKHVQRLIDYPYSCNEQLSSRLMALLIARDFHEEVEVKRIREQEIKRIIRKLQRNQNEQGLWGWWNQSSTSMWVSVHVSEALALAKDAGNEVKIDLQKLADEAAWMLTSRKQQSTQTEMLYIASKLGVKLAYEEFLKVQDTVRHELSARLMLALTKKELGKTFDHRWLMDSLKTDSHDRSYLPARSGFSCFYSNRELEFTARALQLVSGDSTVDQSIKTRLEDYLLHELNSNQYLNTYTTAISLNALSEVLSSKNQDDLTATLMIAGDTVQVFKDFPVELTLEPGDLEIAHEGRMTTYINAYQTYWEQHPVRDDDYFDVRSAFEGGDLNLEAGKKETLKVDVVVKKRAKYVMIEVPIPAGCSYAEKSSAQGSEIHREYHREKVSIFCQQLSEGKHTFEVELLPRYSGSYQLNPAKAELMYFPVFVGHEGVKRVRVD